jgi:hypothetical protein
MALEMGPTPMRLSPLVARAAVGIRRPRTKRVMMLIRINIPYPPWVILPYHGRVYAIILFFDQEFFFKTVWILVRGA